jgi:histone H3/H4
MKERGAYIVEQDAVMELVDYLEEYGKKVTKKALEHAQDNGRKGITPDDVAQALGGYVEMYD